MISNKQSNCRMCAVCRQHREKRELMRIVKNKKGDISIDSSYKADGRGVYICKIETCIEKCRKQRSLNRAFKGNVPNEVYEGLSEGNI